MATIDDKVVAMSFESSKFEQGVNRTISALDKLKKQLTFPNAGKGLDDVNAAARRLDLSHIASGVDSIKSKLGAMRLAGLAVFANLAAKAVSAGAQFVKSFTLQPILQGFQEYSTNLNAVQTILANTQASGAKLKDVNAALNELNTYSDKTIYNFSEMAKNIGTFTAAGVDLKTSTAAIKGIANLAALSGSNSQQASTAMYQLSQAIAAGRVSLQDWNSVVNAGMGGTVFQRALAQTAEKMGTLKDGAVKLSGKMKNVTIDGKSFRESIQAKPGEKSWLTSDVLTKTLSHFTGDLTDAQLAAEGFNKQEIKAIQAQAKTAMNAATQVKTLQQVFDVARETIGSGWAKTFQTVFGDFGEAKTTFTALSNAINGFINTNANARNKVLADWKALGGRKILIDAIKTSFHDLVAVLKPIKDAFREIFPAKTGKDLFNATVAFQNLAHALTPSAATVDKLKRTFAGLFAILDIGKQIVGGIFRVLGSLFGEVGKGSGGFLSITAAIGDFLVKLDKSLKQGDRLTHFFQLLGSVVAAPIKVIEQFAAGMGRAAGTMHPLSSAIDGVRVAWEKLTGTAVKSQGIFQPIIEGMTQVFAQMGQSLTQAITNINFNTMLNAIEVGLIGGLVILFKKFAAGGFDKLIFGGLFQGLSNTFSGLTFALKGLGGAFNGISQVMSGLTGNLQAMQQKTKAEALKQIAIAIALIAASAVALSMVDPKRLNSALSALTIMLGQLLGSMAILDKIAKSSGFIKMPIIAASMVGLAVAIDLLTLAVLGLSRLNWDQLAKGLGGVGVLLGAISVAAKPLSANSAGLIRAGAGITAIAIGLNVMALAVRQFGSMDLATLGKGLGGVALALIAVGAASRIFPKGMIQIGAGLTIVAAGLLLLSKSVEKFGNMNWSVIGKGIGGIAVALLAIGLAMRLMPKNMIAQAAAIGIVALALQGIAKAVVAFGGMSLEQIAKGLGVLAGSLLILAVGLAAMSEALPGAAALAVAAAGIALLAPALESLGKQSWGQIIKGLVALGAAFAILGAAGVLLAPVAPALLALGAALFLIGGGLALAGAGIALIGVGLSAIAVSGPIAIGLLVKAITSFLKAIPQVAAGFVNGLLSVVQKIAETAPKFVEAIVKIISAIVSAIPPLAPKLAKALIAILVAAIQVLSAAFPRLVEAGAQMIISLLKGISNHITEVTKMVVTIIAKFLNAIANSIGKIVTAGGNILIKLLSGIAKNIGKVVTAAGTIIAKFISGIVNSYSKIVTAGTNALAKFIGAIASGASKLIKAGTNLIVSVITGVGNAGPRIIKAATTAMTKFINAITNASLKLVDKGAQAVVKFLNGVANAINKYEPQIIKAGFRIGRAIVSGMISGIGSLAGALASKVEHMITSLPKKGLKLLGIGSPSKVFEDIGKNIVLGLVAGISKNSHKALNALTLTVQGMVFTFQNAWQGRIAALGESNIRALFDLGNTLSSSFQDGLLSGVSDRTNDPVTSAFSDIVKQLAANADDTEKAIQDEKNSIKASNAEIKQDWADLARARKKHDKDGQRSALQSLQQHEAERKAAQQSKTANEQYLSILRQTSGFILTDRSLAKQATELQATRALYEDLNKQLETQTQNLEDLKSKRQSLFDQTFDKFSALPGIVAEDADGNKINAEDQVNNYINSLSGADDAVYDFSQSLDKLQGMGLNADTYQQLLDIGPAAKGFADALIKMGPSAVTAINNADTELRNAASILANHGADEMYATGIATAQGLVNGLNDKIADAVKVAEKLAAAIVKAIRRKLKIKSPSEVFAEIGQLTMEGMAQGISDSSKLVANAASAAADDAISAMTKSVQDVHAAVVSELDPNPTITPVLDLTQVQNGSKSLASMFGTTPIGVVSLGQAASVSTGQNSPGVETVQPSVIRFEQNNYSPESLSPIEIYRQTKNQLSQAKAVLAT